jgi:hypothetical protein
MLQDQIGIRIHERNEAEQALCKSEDNYRFLVENIHEVLYQTNKKGMVTYVSPTIEALTGFSQAEVEGRHFSQFIFKEDFERIRKFVKGLVLGIGCASLLVSPFAFASVKPTKPDALNKRAVLQKAVKLQIPFIENQGQVAEEVRFYAKTFGGTLFVTKNGEMIYAFPGNSGDDKATGWALKETLLGAGIQAPQGDGPCPDQSELFYWE